MRAVPAVPWAARSRWRARPSTLAVLVAGLWVFGTGEALLVASRWGNTPWTVLAEGISKHSPLSIGAATVLISGIVLLGWAPLRERPGLGTVANAVVIAAAIDVMLAVLPRGHATAAQSAETIAGIVSIGVGSALYLSTALGPGPRDGWMTGIARRQHWSLARVRLGIEAFALSVGALLGGRVGVGTVVFALAIGYVVAGCLRILAAAVVREP